MEAYSTSRWPIPAILGFLLILSGCGQPGARGQPGAGDRSGGPTVPQRVLHIVSRDEPTMMSDRLDRDGQGAPFTVSLVRRDEKDVLQPLLAEKVPSQDDGTWIINADGTMRTTYTLKPNLRWQDGQPHTAHDFAFAHRVYTDREVPVTTRVPESIMREAVARDDRTLEIVWREPYVWANGLAGSDLAPLPRHLLEDLYQTDKAAFATSSFWTSEDFVGNGYYRLARWERGVSMTAEANPHFVLGRPKIDTIEYRWVTDANTTVANFLAGATDFAQYTAINVEQALTLRERWEAEGAGRIYSDTLWGVRYMEFQHRDVPGHQKAVRDVRVRQALVHAIDRQALADVLQHGFSSAPDSTFPKHSPLYARIEQAITKYPYDLRRAEALLAEAGWARGGDGVTRDASGQPLELEIRVTSERQQEQAVIADDWKRAGISANLSITPRGLVTTGEYRASFPAVDVSSHSYNRDFIGVVNVTSEQAARPENRYQAKNRGNYRNPELDRLHDLYLKTVDQGKRDEIAVEIERIFTADVAQGLLYYIPQVAAVRAGLTGIKPPLRGSYTWNLWEWAWQ